MQLILVDDDGHVVASVAIFICQVSRNFTALILGLTNLQILTWIPSMWDPTMAKSKTSGLRLGMLNAVLGGEYTYST
jgi:hypothetical protein